ncbi:hypothetical protein ACTWQL_11950 [Pseudalkalibacillus sp. R45]|uniref:hypothetical protein n=1 Tax=Pseudalkalibacillus sp. R45 TaxID=3457433 RepID=UPI003FCDAA59
MAGNNVKVIIYSGLSSSKVKYPVAKTVIGTIIKGNGPNLRVKTELGNIVEIAKSKVFDVKDK